MICCQHFLFSKTFMLSHFVAGSRADNEEEEEEEEEEGSESSSPVSYQMKPPPEGCCTTDGKKCTKHAIRRHFDLLK